MSACLEALRAQYELDLKCPKCGTENIRSFISCHIVSMREAVCDACGHAAGVERFLPPVKV
jgi:predicted RNA-binding Zn-ribbon protein involved in translation (DUF1610 family)